MLGVRFVSSYGHRNACKQFIHFKSETILDENVKNKLLLYSCTNFLSVLCDGSTDSSTVGKDLIYANLLIHRHLCLLVHSLPLNSLQCIEESFWERRLHDIPAKMVFLSSDGAATVTNSVVSG